MVARSRPSFDAVVGTNVKRMRTERGYSQDDLARLCRDRGLKWSRSTVAAVEACTKKISAEELVLLPIVLDVEIEEFVRHQGTIRLGDEVVLRRWQILLILANDGNLETAKPRDDEVSILGRGWVESIRPSLGQEVDRSRRTKMKRARASASGEAEQKAARKFGIAAENLAYQAFDLWGRSLTEERDRRLEQEINTTAASKSVQALRGHITRQLLAELEPYLGEAPT
jgi:transcriptional regulator with XRE-family HTH domain